MAERMACSHQVLKLPEIPGFELSSRAFVYTSRDHAQQGGIPWVGHFALRAIDRSTDRPIVQTMTRGHLARPLHHLRDCRQHGGRRTVLAAELFEEQTSVVWLFGALSSQAIFRSAQ
ncbi:hypothetical protein WH91_17615 [Devosia psychrophila]|uniref:Uncharacterized protein n=1 Tax=Devosia psychrophila TaxID=728005 RepID=A0ABR5DUY2_9HYPH|nr:hypothetical protein WH91_17615 [Devosia psychrophila]